MIKKKGKIYFCYCNMCEKRLSFGGSKDAALETARRFGNIFEEIDSTNDGIRYKKELYAYCPACKKSMNNFLRRHQPKIFINKIRVFFANSVEKHFFSFAHQVARAYAKDRGLAFISRKAHTNLIERGILPIVEFSEKGKAL